MMAPVCVGGAVVDGDDVEVGIVLLEERVEGGGDVGGFVAGGDDDGERGSCGIDGWLGSWRRSGTRGRPRRTAKTF